MLCPFVEVHPSKKDEQQIDEKVPLQRILYLKIFKFMNNFIRNIDYLCWLLSLPKLVIKTKVDPVSQVIQEAE